MVALRFDSNVQLGRSNLQGDPSEYGSLIKDNMFCEMGKTPAYPQTVSLTQFVFLAFFLTCGGPYGLEAAVNAGGAGITLLGILILPLIWSIPQALLTAELSTMMPENGGSVVWVYRGLGQHFGALNAINVFISGLIDKCIYPNIFMAYWPGATDSWIAMVIGRPVLLICLTAINAAGIRVVADSLVLMLIGTLAVFVIEIPYAVRLSPGRHPRRPGDIPTPDPMPISPKPA